MVINKFGKEALDNEIDMNSLGIDLVIFPIMDEMEEEVIAAASPMYIQEENSQPILGVVYINILFHHIKQHQIIK